MKVNDLFVMESVYNNQNGISDIIAHLHFPQKYLRLEYEDSLYSLDIVSVDSHEFVLKVVDSDE